MDEQREFETKEAERIKRNSTVSSPKSKKR